jgi:hypothetical protein
VYEPRKAAQAFTYDGKSTLAPAPVDPALAKEALATALWPSWAYKELRYRLPEKAAGAKP